jgi:energy-converting hydrogenase B subunit D
VSALAIVAFALVAVGGTIVVLTREPARQVLVAGIQGVLLVVLFAVLQAPDVALAALAVGQVAFPLLVLLCLARVREGGG